MTRLEREALRERFGFACGYCGVSEVEVGSELTVDHFHPQSQNGADDESNWIYCCFACNTFKGAYWPLGETQLALLKPHDDDFSLHLGERDGVLIGLSPRGEWHIEQLHLNRAPLVAHRLDVAQRHRDVQDLQLAREELERVQERRRRREAEFERELDAS